MPVFKSYFRGITIILMCSVMIIILLTSFMMLINPRKARDIVRYNKYHITSLYNSSSFCDTVIPEGVSVYIVKNARSLDNDDLFSLFDFDGSVVSGFYLPSKRIIYLLDRDFRLMNKTLNHELRHDAYSYFLDEDELEAINFQYKENCKNADEYYASLKP